MAWLEQGDRKGHALIRQRGEMAALEQGADQRRPYTKPGGPAAGEKEGKAESGFRVRAPLVCALRYGERPWGLPLHQNSRAIPWYTYT